MWKVHINSVYQTFQPTEVFLNDLFTWASNNPYVTTESILTTITEPRLLMLASRCNKLRFHMGELSNCSELDEIYNMYYEYTEFYYEIISGAHIPKITTLSDNAHDIAYGAFKYFYEKLIDNITFWKAYADSSVVKNKKTYRAQIGKSLKVCPYCDAADIGPFSRSNLDHFLPITKYPVLGIYWRNLLLSCTACNGILVKGNNLKLPILHPYFDDPSYEIEFKFNETTKEINVDSRIPHGRSQQKSINYYELFKLDELYCSSWRKVENEKDYLFSFIRELSKEMSIPSAVSKTLQIRQRQINLSIRIETHTKFHLDLHDNLKKKITDDITRFNQY